MLSQSCFHWHQRNDIFVICIVMMMSIRLLFPSSSSERLRPRQKYPNLSTLIPVAAAFSPELSSLNSLHNGGKRRRRRRLVGHRPPTNEFPRQFHAALPRGSDQSRPYVSSTTTLRLANHQDSSHYDEIRSITTTSSTSTSLSPIAQSIDQAIQQQLSSFHPQEEQATVAADAIIKDVHIVLSVSGGCDSMALFHACMELLDDDYDDDDGKPISGETTKYHWHVIHFHHRQRSKDADEDCQLVQEQCSKYDGVNFHVFDWNDNNIENQSTSSASSTSSSFSQGKARNWRRTSLLQYTQDRIHPQTSSNCDEESSVGMILTAHHLNDSQESLLLKLLRGVHVLNLSGIEPVTSLTKVDTKSTKKQIWLLRPLLPFSKQDLKEYLQYRNMQWREDISNQSSKYLRNRIRNELIPLLSELLSFSSLKSESPTNQDGQLFTKALDKRLSTLVQQCQQLQDDVQPRVDLYMQDAVDEEGFFDCRKIGTTTCSTTGDILGHSPPSGLIVSQALYQWMRQRIEQDSSSSASFLTYDTIKRTVQQVQNHPEQLEWTLELGNHWNVQRRGIVLQMSSAQSSVAGAAMDLQNRSEDVTIPWSWRLSTGKNESNSKASPTTAKIAIPQSRLSSTLIFHETNILEADTDPKKALRFIPPWRNSAVKLRQFLRGQNVPLHKRGTIPILLFHQSTDEETDSNVVVAVFVNGEWIIDKRFQRQGQQQEKQLEDFVNIQIWKDEN